MPKSCKTSTEVINQSIKILSEWLLSIWPLTSDFVINDRQSTRDNSEKLI